MLQQAPPALVSRNVGNGHENVLAASEAFALGGGAGGVSAEVSGADFEISSGGEGGEVERCEGCGRTFAPGRLQSHAKVNQNDFFFTTPTVYIRFCLGCFARFVRRGATSKHTP